MVFKKNKNLVYCEISFIDLDYALLELCKNDKYKEKVKLLGLKERDLQDINNYLFNKLFQIQL